MIKLNKLICLTFFSFIHVYTTSNITIDDQNINYTTIPIHIENDDADSQLFNNLTSFNNILLNRKLPILKNLTFDRTKTSFDLIINTGSIYSTMINKNCTTCNWTTHKYDAANVKKNSDISQSLSFGKLYGYIDTDKIYFPQLNKTTSDFNFVSVSSSDSIKTQTSFSGLAGFGSSYSDNNISIINKLIEKTSLNKIIGIQYPQNQTLSNGTLYLGGFPENITSEMTFCKQYSPADQTLQNYWSCKMDYILIGNEYDFYLAKAVDQFVMFDTLSYFNILPYQFLKYFQNIYFSGNNNCTMMPIDSNSTLFRMECYSTKQLINIKPVHIILNGWAYRLGSNSLFDRDDVLDRSKTKNNTYYLRILFSTTQVGWTIGNTFMNRFMLGFNYSENQNVLFYSYNKTDRYNFSIYTREDMPDENNLFIFSLLTVGLVIFFLIFIMYFVFSLKIRKILKVYNDEIEVCNKNASKLALNLINKD